MDDEDHDGWMAFDGTPAPARRPPITIVYAPPGLRMNDAQSNAVSQEFRVFSRNVKASSIPEGWHTHHVEFSDGTKAEFRAMQGEFTTEVWLPPQPSGQKLPRTFVLRPVWQSPEPTTGQLKPVVLKRADTAWAKWDLGVGLPQDMTPTYTVVPSTNAADGRRTEADQLYFDVYMLRNQRLIRNRSAVIGLPTDVMDTDVPVLRTSTPKPVVFLARPDGSLLHVNESVTPATLDTKFSSNAELAFIVGGTVFRAGARHDRRTNRLKYTAGNLTGAGAYQLQHVSLTLLEEEPWVTYTPPNIQQLNAPGVMQATGGYTRTDEYTPTSPNFSVNDSEALVQNYSYRNGNEANDPDVFIGKLYGTDIVLSAGQNPYLEQEFVKSETQSSSETMYDDWTCQWRRQVDITSRTNSASNAYWVVRSAIAIAANSNALVPGAYLLGPTIPGGMYANIGDPVAGALFETFAKVEHRDGSFSESIAGPLTLHRANIEHTIDAEGGGTTELKPSGPPPPEVFIWGTESEDPGVLRPAGYVTLVPKAQFPGRSVSRRLETFTLDAFSRDYLYYDEVDGVSVWVEANLTGSALTSFGVVTTSEAALTINVKVQTPIGSATKQVMIFNSQSSPNFVVREPRDITFPTSDRVWTFVSPAALMPVFAPPWQMQGGCPHVAYTIDNEDAEFRAAFISFRLQLVMTNRGINMPSIPTLENAQGFAPMMLEQMLQAYWPDGARPVFSRLEEQAVVVDVTLPGPSVMTSLGLSDPAAVQANFYRV